MPNIHFSFRRGSGDVPEILYGKVEIKPTLAFARGTSLVLPAPTTLDLVNGEATANNVYPTPAPVAGQVEWAYRVKAIDTRGQSFEWMVGVPDSTGTVEFTALPRYFETKPPLFGKGDKGDPGEAAKITIGTTTSGTAPSVTNSGTNQNAILDFVLPKGDKGDRGDGVPAGGTALQYVRKDSAGTATEWATLDKGTVGLTNVDNTSDVNKPVSTAQATAIANATTLGANTKAASDPLSSYPVGVTVTNARVSAGWPNVTGSHADFVRVVTERVRGISSGIQFVSAYVAGSNGNINNSQIGYRVADSADAWGDWQYLTRDVVGGYAENQMAYFNNVKLGKDAMAAAVSLAARNNNAFGIGALYSLAQGRYNDAFGLNALYYLDGTGNDPNGTAATRNSAFGSNTQRFNKSGSNNVSFGRNSLQCNVAGTDNLAFGAGSMAGLAPLGLDGVIINGTPGSPSRNVALGTSTLDQTTGNDNVAVGHRAAVGIKRGYGNIAIGPYALEKLESGVGFNGNVKDTVNQSGTFTASGNTVVLTITGHTARVGDIVHTALSGQERQFLDVTAITSNSVTCAVPYTIPTPLSGTATIESIIRGDNAADRSSYNVAIGHNALNNLSGNGATGNLAFGFAAGLNMADGTPNTNSRNCVYLGRNAAVSGDAQVQLGNTAMTVYAQQAIQIRSDARDKADVRDTVLGLDFINKLRPVDYKWDIRQDYFEYEDYEEEVIDEEGKPQLVVKQRVVNTPEPDGSKKRSRYHHGLIAQEVEAVIEESGVDFGGFQDHKVNGGSDIKTVGYEELIAPLIKAVQELSAEVKALKESK